MLSAWSGIRPLAIDPSAKSTESISRDHVVCEDYPGLVTITGGKWTTYRRYTSHILVYLGSLVVLLYKILVEIWILLSLWSDKPGLMMDIMSFTCLLFFVDFCIIY